ncbi:sex hormone-binding globulin [Genypterus blacodes]|uniref:sex hormone-binding globulin n=1 Tax=Genypterus blacodes TaxID=154954 RepID=UPI003F75C12E
MAVFWKAMTSGLLLTVSLAVLQRGAEAQGNGRGKKAVSGQATIYLGQNRDIWRPLIQTTVNLTEIRSIMSTFELRTFDPEGVVFYGDTENGIDWFVLSLSEGIPLMQISKEDVLVSVMGGPKLNDGKWHVLEVSSQGRFVVLDVDGSQALVVGMQSEKIKDRVLKGEMRLALGGILIDEEKLIVQFPPQMDGCVREGRWLNLTTLWETEAEELWPCYQNIQPGSFFPGTGFAIFNTSVFPFEAEQVEIEIWGDFAQMDGTIWSIKAPGQELMITLMVNKYANEVKLTFGNETIIMNETFKRLMITLQKDFLQILRHEDQTETPRLLSIPLSHPGCLNAWREGRLAIGGLLGDGEDNKGSHFLRGCLEKIQVQGKDLDLDLAEKHASVLSHSCPAEQNA